ncbi:MAG: UTP--glucose-1-phosphate uridylyltransferase [Planctomycetota bacterium]|jgi:UDP-N-acetylglucosamine/UDP-N-acetylgalactosamine diphosphorylase
MRADRSIERIRHDLAQCGQEHLLTFWDELSPSEKEHLVEQISDLDLSRIPAWVETLVRNQPDAPVVPHDFQPAESYSPLPRTGAERDKYARARQLGDDLVSAGKVAGFVVAGGQGTRLGFDGPKGNYPISPVRNKTLFRVFAETITAVSQRHSAVCPWYVMTSPLNHTATVDIFESNGFYELGRKNVFIFQQGTLPNFGFDGKILLADRASIARSPDGHGGCIQALHHSGALADMKKRGVEYISYWQVDNPLVNLFDPLFIGLHALDEAQMSSKAVIKNAPGEKVGNFCLVDGKVTVIEYSDLPDELADKRKADDSLLFGLGSIAIHMISTSFVEQLSGHGVSLPLHRAVKKVPHVDLQGQPVEPMEANGIKLESFVFDALPMTENSVILEIERSDQFAPTKNATGVDSAESTRAMMVARAVHWLESAGVQVPRLPDGSADCLIELAPSFALGPEDVKAKRDQIPPIRPGDTIYLA